MANISNYLSMLWQQVRSPGNQLVFPFFLLLIASIPVALNWNNAFLIFFSAASVYVLNTYRFFRVESSLLLPVSLFVLMALSILWSVDAARSADSLFKEIALFAIPVCFMMFPAFSASQRRALLEKYGYAMTLFGLFYFFRAVSRFVSSGDTAVFFYHELVTEDVNAIHVSVYFSVAFFALLSKSGRRFIDWICLTVLGILLVLLSSKNIIVVFLFLLVIYLFAFAGLKKKRRWLLFWVLVAAVSVPILFVPQISERFRIEYDSMFTQGTSNPEFGTKNGKVYNVTVSQAWRQETFSDNDFFPGAAFRVYQTRIFCEMLAEDDIFFTGFGLNASNARIREKAIEHKIWLGADKRGGYQGKNFHNQYVQNFADLGIFGLLLLLAMLLLNLKNGVRAKDFTHISFAVLMISLFLTESFLWRQRGVVFFTAMYCLLNSGGTFHAFPKNKNL